MSALIFNSKCSLQMAVSKARQTNFCVLKITAHQAMAGNHGCFLLTQQISGTLEKRLAASVISLVSFSQWLFSEKKKNFPVINTNNLLMKPSPPPRPLFIGIWCCNDTVDNALVI